jgi:tripartite-type tricarboxylate transporter receptor subunit TctC
MGILRRCAGMRIRGLVPAARRSLLIAAALCCAVATSTATAQSWPTQPIRLIIPFAAGGATDVMARALGEHLGSQIGQPVIAENRPGASAGIAAALVARSAPNGYTVLVGSATIASALAARATQSFDLFGDFDFIGKVGWFDLIVVTTPQTGLNSLGDLVNRMRTQPGRVQFGSPGVGAPAHLGGELLKQLVRADALHVPYPGEAPALADVLGGRLTFQLCSTTSCLPRIQDGSLRALAVASRARSSLAPQIPTGAEAGVPGFEADSWNFLAVARGTPSAVVSRLNAALNSALADPAFRTRMRSIGAELETETSPEKLRAQLLAEVEKWRPLAATTAN